MERHRFDSEFVIARSRKQSRTKKEVQRRIELHPGLKAELLRWRRRRAKVQYVLGDPKTLEPLDIDLADRHFWRPLRGTQWCLDRIKNRYKIGFHTYRHSFASNLAAAGVDQRLIDAFMGHQTEEMRRRYQHLLPINRKSAVLAVRITTAAEAASESKALCGDDYDEDFHYECTFRRLEWAAANWPVHWPNARGAPRDECRKLDGRQSRRTVCPCSSGQVASFLQAHDSRLIVCSNAAETFWAIDRQLRTSGHAQAVGLLRRAVDQGRFVDIRIWQQLYILRKSMVRNSRRRHGSACCARARGGFDQDD